MRISSIRHTAGVLAVLASAGIAGSAHATGTIDLFYNVPKVGISLDYRGMGYTDANGDFIDLAGQQIESAHVEVDFTPAPGVDYSGFHMDMVVPVSGAQSQYFSVDGSQLVETTPGTYHFDLTTNDFNGTIYSGRYSIESYGLDAFGNPVSLAGVLSPTTGFYFTVSSPVPETASAGMLLAGLGILSAVVRRRR